MMNEHDDLISRLRAFGRRPVDAGLADRHLSAMAAPSLADAPRSRHRLRVVAAFAVGLLAGTTGLATAGALPNGVQEIAHHTLGSVGVNVPHGDRYQGPECGGVVKNHGQYVRSQPKGDRAAAAASRCGKPLGAGAGDDGSDDGNGGAPKKSGGCQGPPPWAGKGKPDQAAKDARKQACGDHDGDAEDEPGDDQKAGEGQTAPTPAPEAVQGAGPDPETTSPSATTTPPVTAEPSVTTTTASATTSTTTPSDDTTSTTAVPVPVPGLGS
jgi:hypothetical protein